MNAVAHEKCASRGPCADRLKDKVVLVTGIGGGMGRVVALLFAEAGAKVVGCDINKAGLDETTRRAAERGLSIDGAVADASSEDQMNSWAADAVRRHGRIDVLYNNGASTHMAPFGEMTGQQWRETMRLELDVVFFPTRAVWSQMVDQRGGSIINIASVAGMLGGEGTGGAAHCAGKGGVIALTRQLATEGGPHGIRVNSIAPGPIMTDMIRPIYEGRPGIRVLFDRTPAMERHGYPSDVAYAGLFLASDEAMYVTGANLPVDGGQSCKTGVILGNATS